jgi:hypothetical protein
MDRKLAGLFAAAAAVEAPVFETWSSLSFHHYCVLRRNEEAVEEAEASPALYSPPRLSGWSCRRTPPRREPTIFVSS